MRRWRNWLDVRAAGETTKLLTNPVIAGSNPVLRTNPSDAVAQKKRIKYVHEKGG